MDFSLSSEQLAIQDSVRRFCTSEYKFTLRREALQLPGGFSRDHWATFAELGWLGAALPLEDEAATEPAVRVAIVMQEFGKALVVSPFISCAILAARALHHGATLDQRERLMAAMQGGSALFALAHNELNSNWQVGAVALAAECVDGGYLLTGTKTLVLDGQSATELIVSARTSGCVGDESGISLFLVPADAIGLMHRNYTLIDGSRACDLQLTEVRVGRDRLLGKENAAGEALSAAVQYGLLAFSAEAVGAMDAVIALTADYLKNRRQYGVVLGTLQALQHRMADMLVEVELSRSILLRALSSFRVESPRARAADIAACKAHIGHSGKYVAANGVQLHGALGFSDEHRMGHYFKRLTSIASMLGDTSFHLNNYLLARSPPSIASVALCS
jgi:alkylation response protein AidB-like acyl-CoA dehydrogenase